jgi:hypothetical protein
MIAAHPGPWIIPEIRGDRTSDPRSQRLDSLPPPPVGVLFSEIRYLLMIRSRQLILSDEQCVKALLGHFRKRNLEVFRTSHLVRLKCHSKRTSRSVRLVIGANPPNDCAHSMRGPTLRFLLTCCFSSARRRTCRRRFDPCDAPTAPLSLMRATL